MTDQPETTNQARAVEIVSTAYHGRRGASGPVTKDLLEAIEAALDEAETRGQRGYTSDPNTLFTKEAVFDAVAARKPRPLRGPADLVVNIKAETGAFDEALQRLHRQMERSWAGRSKKGCQVCECFDQQGLFALHTPLHGTFLMARAVFAYRVAELRAIICDRVWLKKRARQIRAKNLRMLNSIRASDVELDDAMAKEATNRRRAQPS